MGLRVFGKEVLRKICGHKREKKIHECGENCRYNEKLHNFYFSLNIIGYGQMEYICMGV